MTRRSAFGNFQQNNMSLICIIIAAILIYFLFFRKKASSLLPWFKPSKFGATGSSDPITSIANIPVVQAGTNMLLQLLVNADAKTMNVILKNACSINALGSYTASLGQLPENENQKAINSLYDKFVLYSGNPPSFVLNGVLTAGKTQSYENVISFNKLNFGNFSKYIIASLNSPDTMISPTDTNKIKKVFSDIQMNLNKTNTSILYKDVMTKVISVINKSS